MRAVVALGGNALLRRGEELTSENQRANVRIACEALAPVALAHELVVSHGNGPQVGLLALQGAAYTKVPTYPLDVLDAETQGMIGYLVEQELGNRLPIDKPLATLLTMIQVDDHAPGFDEPTKPIGPIYDEATADELALTRGWTFRPDGDAFRRVVPSPEPKRIFELRQIEWLLERGCVVICAGGGGIPPTHRPGCQLVGVEGGLDQDRPGPQAAAEPQVRLERHQPLGPQLVGGGLHLLRPAAVVEPDVGGRPALPRRRLGGDPGARVGGRHAAADQPLDPHLDRGVHHDHQVEARRKAVLDQQRDVLYDHRLRRRLGDQLCRPGADQRVHDRVEPGPRSLVAEHQPGHGGAVERAVRLQHASTERIHDGGEPFGARRDHLAGQPVGVDDHGAVLGEPAGHRRLARPHASGQPNAQHDSAVCQGTVMVNFPARRRRTSTSHK